MDVKHAARAALDRAGLMGLYFRFVEWRIARGQEAPPATDEHGLPLPPKALMARVIALSDWRAFLSTGADIAKALDGHARDAGLGFRQAQRILDFGCGCGRVMRHLPQMTGAALYGVDLDRALAGWCADNLPGAYSQNDLRPPLDFPDAYFDIVYLLSVFTHLRIPTQREWLAEFARVIRPGGLALVSFHDEKRQRFPDTPGARGALEKNGYYIYNDLAEGSNLISTYQTAAFSEKLFAAYFDVVRIVPGDESGLRQALGVLRRRRENG
ncbi:MAG: class I SAM-dependent methyltransferase [Hyphococcus sp.]